MRQCVLRDEICIECGQCNYCDLDPSKICDNCCSCIEGEAEYAEVLIDEIIEEE